MTTVVSRSGIVSEKPSRTVLVPKDLWTSRNSIMRRSGRTRRTRRSGRTRRTNPLDLALAAERCSPLALDRPVRPDRRVRLSQEHQRPERVQHQNRLATQDDRARRVPADTLCPAPGGEPHETTGEGDGDAEARRLYQTEPDVFPAIEEPKALHEFERGEVEQIDGGQPAGGDADRDRECGDNGKHDASRQHARHNEIAPGIVGQG